MAVLLLLAILAPLAAVLAFAMADTGGLWAHLRATLLQTYVVNSLLLVSGVVAVAAALGVGLAWLVTTHDFPGRRLLEYALILPLAMPAYILAYAWTDMLQVTGPVQELLRQMTGWSVRDYWFPEIRSLGGAIFVLSLGLFPYLYLLARAAFTEQSASATEAARTLGLSHLAAFRRVALPMARPAIAAGAILVGMETLADFGAVKYFELEVFTTGIYRAWFATGNPAAAAQLASLMLACVLLAVILERASRQGRRFAPVTGARRRPARTELQGTRAIAATLACSMPVLLGFFVPATALGAMAIDAGDVIDINRLQALALNTFMLGILAAMLLVVVAMAMAMLLGRRDSRLRQLARVAELGYATPGIVVAIGLLVVAGTLDAQLRTLGILGSTGTGLLFSGSIAVLLYACLVRFFAVAYGPLDAAWLQMGTRYADPARTLGHRPASIFRRVDLPLLRGSMAAVMALVFVEVVKELPATMILRPFNFDTLATEAFQLATTERLDLAAVPALAIAAVGLVPVVLLCLGLERADARLSGAGVQAR
ncbi:MAG: iron ABC transporter permease [Alphaproteobacteria bacterium]|nr:iron ABC transporter permease [Alphaproteobacteria bacterium]